MTRGVARDFLALFEVDENGCWNFTGPIHPNGYGWAGKHRSAHRYFYRELVGPIPQGLVIDHLCRNHGCVNPAHLEPVTVRENTMRGINFIATNAQKTHCLRGHELTPDNLASAGSRSSRICKACRRIYSKRKYGSKQARPASPLDDQPELVSVSGHTPN